MKKVVVFFPIILALSSCGYKTGQGYRQNGFQEYNKQYIVENYHSLINSNLSIFPDQLITEEENVEYHAYITNELFDDNNEIYLSCVYEEEIYKEEVERLKAISITIKYKNQEHTNYIKYDETSYKYPAYISSDGFASVYEYALLLEENRQIVYLYLYSPNSATFEKYPDYVKKDTSSYKKLDTLTCFTIYNHSFDGGKSYIEFDD